MSKRNIFDLLQAFSHWTYHITADTMLVVDLQGVEKEGQFILTDPSIHCKEDIFGCTNLGDTGIKLFFKSHICSSICKSMALVENNCKFDGSDN